MKQKMLCLFVTLSLVCAACSKKDDENTVSKSQEYAAAMAGDYVLHATTVLYDAQGVVVPDEGETIDGNLSVVNPSENTVVIAIPERGVQAEGYTDDGGVFHLRTFKFFTVTISEISSDIKLSGNTLGGTAHCRLEQNGEVRVADLVVSATRK